jgi:hypothetical protein
MWRRDKRKTYCTVLCTVLYVTGYRGSCSTFQRFLFSAFPANLNITDMSHQVDAVYSDENDSEEVDLCSPRYPSNMMRAYFVAFQIITFSATQQCFPWRTPENVTLPYERPFTLEGDEACEWLVSARLRRAGEKEPVSDRVMHSREAVPTFGVVCTCLLDMISASLLALILWPAAGDLFHGR